MSDDGVGDPVAIGVPAAGQIVAEMLAEQAGDVGAGGARLSSSVEGISISTIGSDDQPCWAACR
jgi:hypothetical protein